MQDILQTVSIWTHSHEIVGIATVTNHMGAVPRREGAKMAFKNDDKQEIK